MYNLQLDETSSMETLDKAILYFEHLYNVHLSQYKPDCTKLMSAHTRTLLAISNCLAVDSSTLKLSLVVRVSAIRLITIIIRK